MDLAGLVTLLHYGQKTFSNSQHGKGVTTRMTHGNFPLQRSRKTTYGSGLCRS